MAQSSEMVRALSGLTTAMQKQAVAARYNTTGPGDAAARAAAKAEKSFADSITLSQVVVDKQSQKNPALTQLAALVTVVQASTSAVAGFTLNPTVTAGESLNDVSITASSLATFGTHNFKLNNTLQPQIHIITRLNASGEEIGFPTGDVTTQDPQDPGNHFVVSSGGGPNESTIYVTDIDKIQYPIIITGGMTLINIADAINAEAIELPGTGIVNATLVPVGSAAWALRVESTQPGDQNFFALTQDTVGAQAFSLVDLYSPEDLVYEVRIIDKGTNCGFIALEDLSQHFTSGAYFRINGKQIQLDGVINGTTIQQVVEDIRNKISWQSAGLDARVVLIGNGTVQEPYQISIRGIDSSSVKVEYDASDPAFPLPKNQLRNVTASNLRVTLDGIKRFSTDNTLNDIITGINITVPSTVNSSISGNFTVGLDSTGIKDQLTQFVKAMNQLVLFLAEQRLTDSAHARINSLGLETSLLSAVDMFFISINAGQLARIGITRNSTASIDSNLSTTVPAKYFQFNTEKLASAIATNSTMVQGLLSGAAQVSVMTSIPNALPDAYRVPNGTTNHVPSGTLTLCSPLIVSSATKYQIAITNGAAGYTIVANPQPSGTAIALTYDAASGRITAPPASALDGMVMLYVVPIPFDMGDVNYFNNVQFGGVAFGLSVVTHSVYDTSIPGDVVPIPNSSLNLVSLSTTPITSPFEFNITNGAGYGVTVRGGNPQLPINVDFAASGGNWRITGQVGTVLEGAIIDYTPPAGDLTGTQTDKFDNVTFTYTHSEAQISGGSVGLFTGIATSLKSLQGAITLSAKTIQDKLKREEVRLERLQTTQQRTADAAAARAQMLRMQADARAKKSANFGKP